MDKYPRHPRTLDGRPISAGASGFNQYTTERVDAPATPAPALSPADLLAQLNELKRYFNYPEITQGLKLLVDHIRDKNNPHHTNLDAFTQQVADILHQEYLKRGGTGSLADYLASLFSTLRVAELDEMDDPANERLLISVRGAKQYIQQHENDPNAHAALLEHLFPGTPPQSDPIYAVMAEFGVSKFHLYHWEDDDATADQNTFTGYSFVDSDRRLRYTDSLDDLPVDYSTDAALIPCFSRRTNVIPVSGDLSSLTSFNVNTLDDPSQSAPDEIENAIALVTGRDGTALRHAVFYPDLTVGMNQAKTFSIYAKGGSCRYLAISYQDVAANTITAYGIYDLQEGVCLAVNHLNRYSVNIVELADNWKRCEFTLTHPLGQTADLFITFFKEKTGEGLPELTFQGNNEICGYLWGVQLEDGPNASPYIRTNGSAVTRPAIGIRLALDSKWWVKDAATIHVDYRRSAPVANGDATRPVWCLTSSEGYTLARCDQQDDGTLRLRHYQRVDTGTTGTDTLIYQDILPSSEQTTVQLTHGFDDSGTTTLIDQTQGLNGVLTGPAQTGSYLWLGCDAEGHSFEGYIRNLVLYPERVTLEAATFLNGDEYDN